jgi:hypothetical protein
VAYRNKEHNMPDNRSCNTGTRVIHSPRAKIFSSGDSIYFDWFATGRPTTSTIVQRLVARYPITICAPFLAYLYWRLVR